MILITISTTGVAIDLFQLHRYNKNIFEFAVHNDIWRNYLTSTNNIEYS